MAKTGWLVMNYDGEYIFIPEKDEEKLRLYSSGYTITRIVCLEIDE